MDNSSRDRQFQCQVGETQECFLKCKREGENSDNNPCYLYNWGDFCTGPEGVLSTVLLQCTTFLLLLLLLLLLFFFSLLTNSLEKNFQQNQIVQVLNFFSFFYYRQCGFSLSTRTLLLPTSYPITATQKRRKAEEFCTHFRSSRLVGAHQHVPTKSPPPATKNNNNNNNTQHTKINYKNK
jgi:hypothetical protein